MKKMEKICEEDFYRPKFETNCFILTNDIRNTQMQER